MIGYEFRAILPQQFGAGKLLGLQVTYAVVTCSGTRNPKSFRARATMV